MTKEEMLLGIIKQHMNRLIGSVCEIQSYKDSEDARSLTIKVTFTEPLVHTTRDRYILVVDTTKAKE